MTEQNEILAALYGNRAPVDVDLPSGKHATVREMTGADQRSFMNRSKLMNGSALQELIANCTETVAGEPLPSDDNKRLQFILDMLSGDRMTLVFQIRRHSIGDSFEFATECPQCRTRNDWEVDLSDPEAFKLRPYPNGDSRIIMIDVLGTKMRFKPLDGNDEMRILRMRQTADSLTDLSLRSIHVNVNETWVPLELNKLQEKYLNEIRKQVRINEGELDTSVKLSCPNCASQVSFNLIEQPNFITPNMDY